MFTGLIEKTGTLVDSRTTSDGARLTIGHEPWETDLVPGDSVAVQGACLTVTECSKGQFSCDVLQETLAKSNLGQKKSSSLLNLERALKVGDRLDGHIVTGHIDGCAKLKEIRNVGRDIALVLECENELLNGIVMKGSVAIDGISLTVSNISAHTVEVSVIPFTVANTSLTSLKEGDSVNIETDMLGKYVLKHLANKDSSELTLDDLHNAGFTS